MPINPLQAQQIAAPSPQGAFYSPNAFTGASFVRQEADSAAMAQLAKQIQGMNLEQQLREIGEWQQQAPTRQAEDLFKREKAGVDKDLYRRGETAKTRKSELDTDKMERTQESTIAKTNIDNQVEMMNKAVEHISQLPKVSAGPGWQTEAGRQLTEMGMPPQQVAQILQGVSSADDYNAKIQAWAQNIKNNIPQQRAIDMQNLKHKQDIEIQKMKGEAALAAAIAGRSPSDKMTQDQLLAKLQNNKMELEKIAKTARGDQQVTNVAEAIAATQRSIDEITARVKPSTDKTIVKEMEVGPGGIKETERHTTTPQTGTGRGQNAPAVKWTRGPDGKPMMVK